MIGVAGRAEAERFQAWVNDNNVTGFDHIADPENAVWREFGITSQPAFAFLNDDGTSESHLGSLGPETLAERVEQLIAS